jgi:hypothetical protein
MTRYYSVIRLIVVLMFFSPAVTAFEISGMYTEEGQKWLNDHWGENITIGDLARIAYTSENYEKIKENVDPLLLEEVWSQPYYWGSNEPWGGNNNPECPFGADIWDEYGPVNISELNASQREDMGIRNAVTDRSGYRIIGYMDKSVVQGEIKPFHRQMPENLDRFTCDLFWQDDRNLLKLTIVTPEGLIGPYYDESDGIVNGRIYLQISRAGGITPGDWYAIVEGERVKGTQQFMMLVV